MSGLLGLARCIAREPRRRPGPRPRSCGCNWPLALACPSGRSARGHPPPGAPFLPAPSRRAFRPDIVHCTSPGTMVLAALLYSRLLRAPLVFAYHTHVPEYMPRRAALCTLWGGVHATACRAHLPECVPRRTALRCMLRVHACVRHLHASRRR